MTPFSKNISPIVLKHTLIHFEHEKAGKSAIDIARENKHSEIALYLENVMNGSIHLDEKREEIDNASKWNAPICRLEVKEFIRLLIEIEKALNACDLNQMNDGLIAVLNEKRPLIQKIFNDLGQILATEIQRCCDDSDYFDLLRRFRNDSKENGKFESAGKIYKEVHRHGVDWHRQSLVFCCMTEKQNVAGVSF